MSVAAYVQAVPKVNVEGESLMLPEKLTCDYAAKLVLWYTNSETSVMTVHIYDNGLKLVKDFSASAQQKPQPEQ